ncbi:MAG: hypothetical protein IT572_07825 [Deltaproteobacteria bacterium]|nr:hypothetical protein [Deltaproteobacteria bacterium]
MESLKRELRLASKSQVIRRALEELKNSTRRSRLSEEIKKSVQKCGKADLEEHHRLTGAAVARQKKS